MTIAELARRAIHHYLETGRALAVPAAAPTDAPQALEQTAGAFVSLHQSNDELRGCIGTIAPTQVNLAAEVIANAIAAATHDPRFPPIVAAELADLSISVDVLTPPAPATNLAQLDPRRDGLIITAVDGRQGVLLPDLEGVDTVADQIAMCRQKANIDPGEPVQVAKFQVKRFTENAPSANHWGR